MSSAAAERLGLVTLYRRYLGEPEQETDVYVGFALFFGGIVGGAFGLLVFLASASVPQGGELFWQLREVAIVSGVLGLPAFVLSVVVLLPVDRRAVYASLGGVALCTVATGIFVATYPHAWNVSGADYSPHGITVYAGGLTVLLASAGAALVAHHLDRVRGADADPAAAGAEPAAETVTDEEVRRDIDETVAASELTWGGVERAEPRRLTLSHGADDDIEPSGFDVAPEVRTAEGVDEPVAELRKLRGWEPATARGGDVDEQTDALRELRAQSAAEADDGGWVRGLVDRFRSG